MVNLHTLKVNQMNDNVNNMGISWLSKFMIDCSKSKDGLSLMFHMEELLKCLFGLFI